MGQTIGCASVSCFGRVVPPSANRDTESLCLPGVDPAEMDRIALAAKQRQRLVQRQADNVGIGADELDHKSAGDALRGITARFAAPFAGGEIGFDVLFGQTLKSHARLYVTLPERFLRRDQTDRGVNAVI